jgi:hypothetical protein
MTTLSNALRFLPAGSRGSQSGRTAAWAPDAATEQSIMLGFVLVALAGAGAVVAHALSQVVAFQ